MIRAEALSFLDVFLAVCARQECSLEELARELLVPEPSWLDFPLDEARASGLLVFQEGALRRAPGARAASLYRGLNFALSYGIDYDLYSDPAVEVLLRATYGRPVFGRDDIPGGSLSPRLLRRLVADGVLVVYAYEPLLARWIGNFFLDELCAWLNVRHPRHTVEVPPMVDSLRSRRFRDFEAPPEALGMLGEPDPGEGCLSVTQRLVQYDLVHRKEGLLDASARRRYEDTLVAVRDRVRTRRGLDRSLVLEYHALVVGDEPGAGTIRETRVEVPNTPRFKVALPEQVEPLLGQMLERYQAFSAWGTEQCLHDAAWLGNEFLHIHPFEDGNSRTARILMSHFFNERRAPIEEIPPTFELLFLLATKGAARRSDENLARLLGDVLIQALNRRDLGAASARRS